MSIIDIQYWLVCMCFTCLQKSYYDYVTNVHLALFQNSSPARYSIMLC